MLHPHSINHCNNSLIGGQSVNYSGTWLYNAGAAPSPDFNVCPMSSIGSHLDYHYLATLTKPNLWNVCHTISKQSLCHRQMIAKYANYSPILSIFCHKIITNFTKIIIMRVILIIEIENLRILYFVSVKSPQITNSRKSKHAKITRSTIYGEFSVCRIHASAEYTRVASAVCVCRIHKAHFSVALAACTTFF